MAEIIDISPVLHEGIAVWPGDVRFSREVALDVERGDHLTLSAVRTTVHVGAHTDAPNHYARGGASIEARGLERYYGRCQILDVAVSRGSRIVPADITEAITAPRVILRTGTFPDPDTFNEDFAALSPALVHWLADQGVQLVGIDTPSIDLCHDAELLSHQAVHERDLGILEGVVLGHVEPGEYTLIALPLRLAGADASPVRAVLVR